MTIEMLNMSKEELITAITNLDKHGKELDALQQKLVESRNDLSTQIDKLAAEVRQIDADIAYGEYIMSASAMTLAELRKLLKDKHDCDVM